MYNPTNLKVPKKAPCNVTIGVDVKCEKEFNHEVAFDAFDKRLY